LRRDFEVRSARSRGKAVAEGPLVVRVLRNTSNPPANRYAVIAGRKSGDSVRRNRLKRVTREALRGLHPHLRPGYDLAIIIRGTVEELPGTAAAREILARLLRRAGLIEHAVEPTGERAR
jgi:ribonuclease P protein component